MVAIEIGRVCKKLQGREAGRFCTVVDLIDDGYVLITGPKPITDVRRRQCNILHLEPTDYLLEIKKNASDDDVAKAYEKANLLEVVKSKKKEATPEEKHEKPKKAEKPKKVEKPKKASKK